MLLARQSSSPARLARRGIAQLAAHSHGVREVAGSSPASPTIFLMRLFISIPLPEKIKKELAKVRDSFPEIPARWVEEENLHLTLVFLGETKETEATKATEAIDTSTKGLKPINLEIDGLLLLPNEKDPHLLAVKLTGETEKLSALVEKIKKELRERKIGFDGKPFRPHTTLARLKKLRSSEKKELREKIHLYDPPKMEFKAEQLELTESKLTPSGPIYKILNPTA